jgi:hypothetical protein
MGWGSEFIICPADPIEVNRSLPPPQGWWSAARYGVGSRLDREGTRSNRSLATH